MGRRPSQPFLRQQNHTKNPHNQTNKLTTTKDPFIHIHTVYHYVHLIYCIYIFHSHHRTDISSFYRRKMTTWYFLIGTIWNWTSFVYIVENCFLESFLDPFLPLFCPVVQAQSPMFKDYISQVLKNSKTMAAALLSKGYTLVSGNLTSI